MSYFRALATDCDGTIAHDGIIDDDTLAALERLKLSGRRLVMVTGRELPDLQRVCPRLDLFDRVVAENGALLCTPATREERPLGPLPPEAFVARLKELGVEPLSVGRVIVATWEPNETTVLAAIRDLGLDLQIIFNKGAVMVLPNGTNEASGLGAALRDLGLSAHNVVATGALRSVGPVLLIGRDSLDLVEVLSRAIGLPCPPLPERGPESGEAVFWDCRGDEPPFLVAVHKPRCAMKRHTRKYAEGTLGEDRSFFFRDPQAALKIRAHNLSMFLQIGDGVDADTYLFHLRNGDVAEWMRSSVKDGGLADEIDNIAADPHLPFDEARALVRGAVEARYTAAATP